MAHEFGVHPCVRAHACARTYIDARMHVHTKRPARYTGIAIVITGMLAAGSAIAQTAQTQTMTPMVTPAVAPTAATMPPDQLDFSLLDDATSAVPIKSTPLAPPSGPAPPAAAVGGRTYKADGSMTMSAGERLATPWDVNWDAKVGVDLATAAGAILQDGDEDHGTGWANVSMPAAPIGLDKATIDARVDPSSDQGKVSAALSRSMPMGDGFSVTLQNGYSVTQTLAYPNGAPSVASPHVYAGDGGVKLAFPTATALTASAQMSSIDERLTPSLSAEQQMFGTPLSITGTISELPTGGTDRSIMAGFKQTW
ncbi:MAG TPA: hypothetical protein VGG01_06520 [Xanthobacteraceae bacterium]|jgi:hypothetical protein